MQKWKSPLIAKCTCGWPRMFAAEIRADLGVEQNEDGWKIIKQWN
jgi:hypothetical protein